MSNWRIAWFELDGRARVTAGWLPSRSTRFRLLPDGEGRRRMNTAKDPPGSTRIGGQYPSTESSSTTAGPAPDLGLMHRRAVVANTTLPSDGVRTKEVTRAVSGRGAVSR